MPAKHISTTIPAELYEKIDQTLMSRYGKLVRGGVGEVLTEALERYFSSPTNHGIPPEDAQTILREWDEGMAAVKHSLPLVLAPLRGKVDEYAAKILLSMPATARKYKLDDLIGLLARNRRV